MESGNHIVSTGQLARLLGISRQRVNELGRKGKITREPDGRWNVAEVRATLAVSLDARQISPAKADAGSARVGKRRGIDPAESHPGNGTPPKGTLLYEQWRLTREKADREALDRKVLEGSLLKREEVRPAVSSMIAAAKNRLITIADELCDKLAASSDPVRCKELVDDRISQALKELAEYPARA